ncbi:protein bicaudal D homolog [Tamlana sp. 62-3]|uniref:Protein bicaudal D homolog n=1 Tax=Neotamlana sargassicola TaxID=2883125 RepID=A0A9X1I857_9FLAO|nr:protein bicaudal D homolog [Tamlana sargassicola]MCB4809582.1 protein bicaudal D homolog [Tamlana sargassicola]
MQTITKCLAFLALWLSTQLINAQDSTQVSSNQIKIEALKLEKKKVQEQERALLKAKVEAINTKLEKGEITSTEAETLKKEAAKKHALNIESRMAIVDSKIDLLARNDNDYGVKIHDDEINILRIGTDENTSDDLVYVGKPSNDKPRIYDKRTSNDFVIAFGQNNALIDGESLNDSPYKIGGSRFFEIGWAWKTRVFKNTNFLRLKYGLSVQMNGLKPEGNRYFVNQNDNIVLEEFPYELDKSKLTVYNFVAPIHFEFGPSKKIEKDDYFRYSTTKKLKFGIGGYGGFNIGARQKLKYDLDGDNKKEKQKGNFNTTKLVYGLSAYIGFDDLAFYAKYDLSPIFNDQVISQNNISLGVRFDIN